MSEKKLDFFIPNISVKNSLYVRVSTGGDKYSFVPSFKANGFEDLILKGGTFYAVYDCENGYWTKDIGRLTQLLDSITDEYYKEYFETHKIFNIETFKRTHDEYFSYLNSKCYDTMLKAFKNGNNINADKKVDHVIKFLNSPVDKHDYSTGKLNYAIEPGSTENWDYLIGTLYEPEEKQKIEWMIGSIITGDSRTLQKFYVLYGDAGTGKSTLLNIIYQMFYKYVGIFDSARLVSGSEFAFDSLADDPLISIQHDGNMSKVVNNEKLNMIVSHELIVINEKNKKPYELKPETVLILGTNSPVQITDAKSGIKRRLIDIHPSGNLLTTEEYDTTYNQIINFERGAIAYKCLQVFQELGRDYYKNYKPLDMEYRTNDFFNFVDECYDIFAKNDRTTLSASYLKYKEYCEDNPSMKRLTKSKFRDELENYFHEHKPGYINGIFDRHVYTGFKKELFQKFNREMQKKTEQMIELKNNSWLKMNCKAGQNESILDEVLKNQPAQYAVIEDNKERPQYTWVNCATKLCQIDTTKLHYVIGLPNLIFIDLDLKNERGEKDYYLNYQEASKWPKTYTEVSKSGKALHLYYFYNGDVSLLDKCYNGNLNIEIKKCSGKSPIRRILTSFNDLEIATLSEGTLPIKEVKENKWEDKDIEEMSDMALEKGLRTTIIKCLQKRVHTSTFMNVSWIKEILDKAYNCGKTYDVSDLYNPVLSFAMNSTHQSNKCLEMVAEMHFKSKNIEEAKEGIDYIEPSPDDEPNEIGVYKEDGPIVFFDIEVFPNLFVFGYKFLDGEKHILVNPSAEEMTYLFTRGYKWVGFNCRNYDNHITYSAINGVSTYGLWRQSQQIINSPKGVNAGKYGGAYNLGYTDIYDYSKKKQSLKKWEIELKISHKELEFDWNSEIPEELWPQVTEYNGYDLDATEAVWKATQTDFTTRQILADISGGCVNDTDNMLTAKLIFSKEKNPQKYFVYRKLSEPVMEMDPEQEKFLKEVFPVMMSQRHGKVGSLLPYFEGYDYTILPKKNEEGDKIESVYMGEITGEGGLVRAQPGIRGRSKTFDVTSQHPHSACAEYLFGPYTPRFYSLVKARKCIKHKDFDTLATLFEGKLMKYVTDKDNLKKLSTALKTPINAVYGLTKAAFANKFRDPRNVDNIVAKRGALFMIDLKNAVEKLGYTVFHVKTDSLKVENPDEYIEKFIFDFGLKYGYEFEVEHVFEKIALVNNAVYIAKLAEDDPEWLDDCEKARKEGRPEPTRWTATGAQFAEPYVFKKLFSHEEIKFEDFCLIKNVTKGKLYLDFNDGLPDVSIEEKVKDLRKSSELKKDKFTKKELSLLEEYSKYSDEELDGLIALGHKYVFVGKVGQFCPVVEGCGGADLMCEDERGNMVSPTGTQGLKWMESDYIEKNNLYDYIDMSYFEKLVDEAKESIYNSTQPDKKKGYQGYGTYEGFIEE